MELENIQGVHPIMENGARIALIDNTYNDYITVVLLDEDKKYTQRFFVKNAFKSMVEDTRTMRRLKIKSL